MILGVRKLPQMMLFYENLVEFLFYTLILAKGRASHFWLKILKITDSRVHEVYVTQMSNNHPNSRAKSINKIIEKLRYSFIWTSSNPWIIYLCKFETEFSCSSYIDALDNETLILKTTHIIVSSQNLGIETHRNRNIMKEDKKCKMCSLYQVESEYHFMTCRTKIS